MRELNYQYKVVEEKSFNGKLILKVNDSIYNKTVFMELYKEVDSSDWDAGYKLEDEIRALKDSGDIDNYFINDDYSNGRKYFYKIYDEYKFDSSEVKQESNEEKVDESLNIPESEAESSFSLSDDYEAEDFESTDNFNTIEEPDLGLDNFEVFEPESLEDEKEKLRLKALETLNEAKKMQAKYDLKNLDKPKTTTNTFSKVEKKTYRNSTSSHNKKEIERVKKLYQTSSYTQKDVKKKSGWGLFFFIFIGVTVFIFIKNSNDFKVGKRGYQSLKTNYENGLSKYNKRLYLSSEIYFRSSCINDKDKRACYKLAYMYKNSKIYKPNKYKQANIYFQQACELKDFNSCKEAGLIYKDKIKDYNLAVKYFTIACDSNDASSCLSAGYLKEVKLKLMNKKTISFYEKACNLKNPTACYNLGLVYEHDKIKGIKDIPKSKELYKKSCDLSYQKACAKLKTKTKVKAINTRTLNRNSEKKSARSLYDLGKKFQDKKKYLEANTYFKQSCNKKYITSCEFLGWNYENGYGYVKNLKKANSYYLNGCNKNSGYSCNKVGVFYERGSVSKKNITQARVFYKKSCNLKYALACSNLAKIYSKGLGVKKNKKTAKVLYKKACRLGYRKACK